MKSNYSNDKKLYPNFKDLIFRHNDINYDSLVNVICFNSVWENENMKINSNFLNKQLLEKQKLFKQKIMFSQTKYLLIFVRYSPILSNYKNKNKNIRLKRI